MIALAGAHLLQATVQAEGGWTEVASAFIRAHETIALVIVLTGVGIAALFALVTIRRIQRGDDVRVGQVRFTGDSKARTLPSSRPARRPPDVDEKTLHSQQPAIPKALSEASSEIVEDSRSRFSTPRSFEYGSVATPAILVATEKLVWQQALRVYDLYNEAVPYHVHDLWWTIEISEKFDLIQYYEWTVSAVSAPLMALGFERRAQPFAHGFSQLNLHVSDGANDRVEFLPVRDEPEEKAFLVFLAPPLVPGSPPVTLKLENRWPRAAIKLGTVRDTDRNTLKLPRCVDGPPDSFTVQVRLPADGHSYSVEFPGKATEIISGPRREVIRKVTTLVPGGSVVINLSRLG